MTTKKRKATEPMAWTCLSCDSDYPRAVKFCPSCHIVSPYETGAFPSTEGQSELARLHAIEKAAMAWLDDRQHEIDSDIPSHSWYVSGAYILKRILAGRGPKESK